MTAILPARGDARFAIKPGFPAGAGEEKLELLTKLAAHRNGCCGAVGSGLNSCRIGIFDGYTVAALSRQDYQKIIRRLEQTGVRMEGGGCRSARERIWRHRDGHHGGP